MRSKTAARARLILSVAFTAILFAASPPPAMAGSEYLLDIAGTVEILGEPDQKANAHPDREVHYWVFFQYRDPTVAGPSYLDRPAQVEDGHFNVEGLYPDKVYRVFIQRVIIDPSLPGGASREEIPLFVPADFWKTVEVGPQGPPVEPLKIDLAVVSPDAANESPTSLSLQYHGKEVRLAAFAAGPGVS